MEGDTAARVLFADAGAYDTWAARWRERLGREAAAPAARALAMRRENPAFIARNHRVEAMIAAAVDHDDFRPFEELLDVLSHPFDEQPSFAHYANPPAPDERVLHTFCGT